jgi:hypothetical protein
MDTDGPLLLAAVCCERVLEDKDGSLSAIRIVDKLTLGFPAELADQPLPPHAMPPIYVLVLVRAGTLRGTHTITLKSKSPSGEVNSFPPATVEFTREDRGINITFTVNLVLRKRVEGLFWLELFLDETRLLTRIPLTIAYQFG